MAAGKGASVDVVSALLTAGSDMRAVAKNVSNTSIGRMLILFLAVHIFTHSFHQSY
jgi:hypothetical protein